MKFPLIAVLALVAGCASIPSGPGVMVLPGGGKSFDQFRFDDHECRQFANGAAAGAAMGDAGAGAGIGLATGALAGAGAANASGRTLQQRYDIGYQQCMYAKGHKIPMSREAAARERPARHYGAVAPPPPPPGYRVN